MLSLNPANSLKQRIGLSFKGLNLPNTDGSSKTDPFCVIWDVSGRQQKKLGNTEVIADSLNPEFVKEVDVDYFFEQQQSLRVDVYDADDATNLYDLKKHDFIGSFQFNLGKLCSSRNQELEAPLENKTRKKSGSIKIMAQEKKSDYGKTQATFKLAAKLKKQCANTFLTINKWKGPGQFQPVVKTECKPQE